MKILIVDDEAEQLRGMKLILMRKGFDVVTVTTSKKALELLQEKRTRVQMVITDYMMPGMDGIQLFNDIRKNNPTLPVILMTAYGDKEVVGAAVRNLFNGYIEKPFQPKSLVREVERVAATPLMQNRQFSNAAEHEVSI